MSFPNESGITHSNGARLLFPAYPEQVSYVRVVDAQDREIAFWTIDEVSEDPADVLGAIFGAVLGGNALR
ncbi:hypothetical protein ATER59S_00528 [Aquamicrobium terrae]